MDTDSDAVDVVGQLGAGDGFKLQNVKCVGHHGFFVEQIADPSGCFGCEFGGPLLSNSISFTE